MVAFKFDLLVTEEGVQTKKVIKNNNKTLKCEAEFLRHNTTETVAAAFSHFPFLFLTLFFNLIFGVIIYIYNQNVQGIFLHLVFLPFVISCNQRLCLTRKV